MIPPKEIEILWLVEHTAREMDVACVVKALMKQKYGIDIVIRNIYMHAKSVLEEYVPQIVVHPFFYFAKGALAQEDFVEAWPNAIHFNMAWEEIHYKAHKKVKAPSDEFTKKNVLHHAWGNFYRDYLMEAGVPGDHIFVNGNPAYQLYKYPYKQYYKNRDELAKKYCLDPSKRWIFIPENYRWAFIGKKIKFFTKLGGDPEEMIRMRDFSIESLKIVLRWCSEIARQNEFEIIFRPRPATNSQMILDFFREHIGDIPSSLRFIKEESVREWIMAGDVVISSYSTSLIEAAIAGKPAYMVEPIPIPDSLFYDWYQYSPHIYTFQDFQTACAQPNVGQTLPLKTWAETEMLSNGDPIGKLAAYIMELVKRAKDKKLNSPVTTRNSFTIDPDKKYFNEVTHENDYFTQEDIQVRVNFWEKILKNNGSLIGQNISNGDEKMDMKKNDILTGYSPTLVGKLFNKNKNASDEAVARDVRCKKKLLHRINKVSDWVTKATEDAISFKKNGEFNSQLGLKYKQLWVLKEMREAIDNYDYICPKFPDFIMIGCTRGATTWAQNILSSHSEVLMHRGEPTFFSKYFNQNGKYLVEHLQPIRPFFDLTNKTGIDVETIIRGEKNPDYLGLPEGQIQFIRKLMPDTKIILSVRDPIDACWSNLHLRFGRQGKNVQETDENEIYKILSGWKILWSYRKSIPQWKNHFKDMLILFFEDISADPEGQASKIFDFLGVKKENRSQNTDFSKKVNEAPKKTEIPSKYFTFMREVFNEEYDAWQDMFGRPPKYK